MTTSPAEQPGSGIVNFTQRGDRALDRLAADLVDHCDGSTASIANVLEQVLSADIAELADKLGESLVAGEAGTAPESPRPCSPSTPRRRPVHCRRRSSPATPNRPLTRRPYARELLRPSELTAA